MTKLNELIKNNTVVVINTETTGLSPNEGAAQIYEISARKIIGGDISNALFLYRDDNNCHKQTVRQDVLEQKVLDMAMELFTSKVNLDIICDEIMRIHEKHRAEQSVLKLLREEKAKAERSLNNVMLAIEEGIINATTKNRMAELERQIDELSGKILIEESKLGNSITREEVMEYLTHSVRDLSPQALIEILVNRIELYDDEIVVWFNYSDRINPDDPDTDSRDFLLPENCSISVTSRFIVVSKKIALR